MLPENHENFFLNRCVIKYYAISQGHIGAGYREIQETGAHRRVLQTLTGSSGSAKNICSRSRNYLSFDVFLDPETPAKVSNQEVQRDPTGGSQTLLFVSLYFAYFYSVSNKPRPFCRFIDSDGIINMLSLYRFIINNPK